MSIYIKNFYIDDQDLVRKDINICMNNYCSQMIDTIYPWNAYYGPRRCLEEQYQSFCNPTLPIALNFRFTSNYSVKLAEVFNAYYKISSPLSNISLYPIAVRYIDDQKNFYIERPPFQKEISFKITKSKSITTKIWIPWTLTAINQNNYNNTRMFFRHDQLMNMTDNYIPACLPNIYNVGRICFSSSLNIVDDNQVDDIRYLYATVFNEYMNGGWNTDLAFVLNDFQYSLNIIDYSKFPAITKFIDITAEDVAKVNPNYQYSKIQDIINFRSNSYDQNRVFEFLSFFLKMSTFSLQETLDFYRELTEIKQTTNNSLIPCFHFENIIQSYNEEVPFHYSEMFNSCLNRYNSEQLSFPNENKELNLIIYNYSKNSDLYKNIIGSNGNTYSLCSKICDAINKEDFIRLIDKTVNNSNKTFTILYDHDNHHIEYGELNDDFTVYYKNFINNSVNTSFASVIS